MSGASDALVALADQALGRGQAPLAETLLRRALDETPDRPDALGRLGLLRLQAGAVDEAVALLRGAASGAPQAAQPRFHLALALAAGGDADAALAAFAEAQALDPGFAPAWHAAASCALSAFPPRPAVQALRHARRIGPDTDDLVQALDTAVLNASRSDEGVSDGAAQRAALVAELPRGGPSPPGPLAIALIDTVDWDYDVATPETRALGGSQSALCYLARALAARGHAVATVTGTRRPGLVMGVECRALDQPIVIGPDQGPPDVAIILNGPGAGPRLRAALGPDVPILLWTQHAHDQPAMRRLEEAAVARSIDGIVCVSTWHRAAVRRRYGIPGPIHVRRNAVAPRFEALAATPEDLARRKGGPPVLVYASTPFRGLDLLLDAFPMIRQAVPDVTLRIFSSLQVYQAGGHDPYGDLYARAEALEGVRSEGSVGQAALADAFAEAHVLAYPNTFPETACITVMEALAAGLDVITSHLGALPETGLGHARLIPQAAGAFDRAAFTRAFAHAVIDSLKTRAAAPADWLGARAAAIAAIRDAATWSRRAEEWEWLLRDVVAAARTRGPRAALLP